MLFHDAIRRKLGSFHHHHNIPNIIFHGPSGAGKSTIVNDFVCLVYDDKKDKIKDYVMYVNCAHGKGIKFIRDELKFFAKSNIHANSGDVFKSIILYNADKLTMDAQSALRRCIELFSHTTRFFIVVEDKYKLLRPILSRFCEIYVPLPPQGNLYQLSLKSTFPHLQDTRQEHLQALANELNKFTGAKTRKRTKSDWLELVSKLYEKGFSGLDILDLLEKHADALQLPVALSEERKYQLLVASHKVKMEFRNEKWLMLFVLNFLYLSSNDVLENISFM